MSALLFVAAVATAIAARVYFGVLAEQFIQSLPAADRKRAMAAMRTAMD